MRLVFDEQVQFVDVILCNRYYAWYEDYGQTELISHQLEKELRDWFNTFHKPVLQSEYGAGAVIGLHTVNGPERFPHTALIRSNATVSCQISHK